MTRKLFIAAALASASAAAALLGACKANDTAGSLSASAPKAAVQNTPQRQQQPSAPAGTTTVHADGVRRVSVAELQKMMGEGPVVLYDTRSKASYEQEHIKGALSMPQNEVANRAGEFPRDKTLVFYCT